MFPVVRRYIAGIAHAVVRAICINAVTVLAHLFISFTFVFIFASICNKVANLTGWTSTLERADSIYTSTAIAQAGYRFAFVDL